MNFLGGKKQTPKEAMRESKREMARGERDMERELMALRREETALKQEIKRAAAQGNTEGAKQLARHMIRLRAQQTKMMSGKAQLRGIATHAMTMQSTATVAKALGSATAAMASMNQVLDPVKQQRTLQEFMKQAQQMDMAEEMMGDAMDDALDNDETEGETNELVDSVLDEIGINVQSQLLSAPKKQLAVAAPSTSEDVDAGEELERRLRALKS